MSFDVATPSTPRATGHVRDERWPDRGDESMTPRQAWRRATVVPAALEYVEAHEARYDEATDTLLLRKFENIVTVIDLTRARDGRLRRTVYAAISNQEDSA